VQQEWAQRLASDPTGTQRALVLVRVEPCQPEGLLGPMVYIDLVGLDEASARERLREELAAVVRGERRLPPTRRLRRWASTRGPRRPAVPVPDRASTSLECPVPAQSGLYRRKEALARWLAGLARVRRR